MKALKEPCKSAIEKGLCLGCTGLGEADWIEPKECKYITTAEQSIAHIKKILGVQEKIEL